MSPVIPDNWYESFFTGVNCELWEKAVTKEWTEAEAAFLIDVFNLSAGSKLLDLPCGAGRHSVELAKKGFRLTAVDISEEFLASLRRKTEAGDLPVAIIHGNVLTMPLTGSFDGAFCLGNSFGYFRYEDMHRFVAKVASVLKGGAQWIINTGVLAESFLSNFTREKTYELDGLSMAIHNDYDVWNGCLLITLTHTKNGQQEVHHFKHHVYTVAELIRLLSQHGLRTTALYGSTDKAPYKLGDAQLYLVAEKAADGPPGDPASLR